MHLGQVRAPRADCLTKRKDFEAFRIDLKMASRPHRRRFGFTHLWPGKILKLLHVHDQTALAASDRQTFPSELVTPNLALRSRES